MFCVVLEVLPILSSQASQTPVSVPDHSPSDGEPKGPDLSQVRLPNSSLHSLTRGHPSSRGTYTGRSWLHRGQWVVYVEDFSLTPKGNLGQITNFGGRLYCHDGYFREHQFMLTVFSDAKILFIQLIGSSISE